MTELGDFGQEEESFLGDLEGSASMGSNASVHSLPDENGYSEFYGTVQDIPSRWRLPRPVGRHLRVIATLAIIGVWVVAGAAYLVLHHSASMPTPAGTDPGGKIKALEKQVFGDLNLNESHLTTRSVTGPRWVTFCDKIDSPGWTPYRATEAFGSAQSPQPMLATLSSLLKGQGWVSTVQPSSGLASTAKPEGNYEQVWDHSLGMDRTAIVTLSGEDSHRSYFGLEVTDWTVSLVATPSGPIRSDC